MSRNLVGQWSYVRLRGSDGGSDRSARRGRSTAGDPAPPTGRCRCHGHPPLPNRHSRAGGRPDLPDGATACVGECRPYRGRFLEHGSTRVGRLSLALRATRGSRLRGNDRCARTAGINARTPAEKPGFLPAEGGTQALVRYWYREGAHVVAVADAQQVDARCEIGVGEREACGCCCEAVLLQQLAVGA